MFCGIFFSWWFLLFVVLLCCLFGGSSTCDLIALMPTLYCVRDHKALKAQNSKPFCYAVASLENRMRY